MGMEAMIGSGAPPKEPASPRAGAAVSDGAYPTAQDRVERLFEDQYRQMLRTTYLLLGSREEAEEVTQEAFAKVLGSLFRIRDDERSAAYLRSAAVNLARARLRRRSIWSRKEALYGAGIRASDDEHAAAAQPDRHVETAMANRALAAALRQLPQRQRECVVLRYFTGLSEAETAATMGVSKGSVKTHHSRALDALRLTLKDLS
jgi:RNA polymerase sigma factor (sigma-70 family)